MAPSPESIHFGLVNRIVDRITAQVSQALEKQGIEHVLLKGPAIAEWLYDDQEVRVYGDSDFLVARWDWDRTVALLTALGFEDDLGSMAHPRMESFTSHPFVRLGANVDLHATLQGLHAPPEKVWAILSSATEPFEVDGQRLRVLAPPARTLHIALHSAQHPSGKAVADLGRALERVDEDTWRQASALAIQLEGVAAFASGLRALPEGHEMADRLGLAHVRSVETTLRAAQVPLAEGIYELSQTPGLRKKLAIVRREFVPTPDFMRWWSPLARRRRLGMAVSYMWRPLWLTFRLPAAVRAVRRAQAEVSRQLDG